MHSKKPVCGYAVYKYRVTRGSSPASKRSLNGAVQKLWFIPTLLNSFYTRFCTLVFDFHLCFSNLFHLFHITYNNHFFLNETNL